MLSAYVYGLQERMEGETIHGEYYQASQEEFSKFTGDDGGTVTGRLSHRNPNLGNLPRKTQDYWKGSFVKDLFIPLPGYKFIYADYSQIELRVAAHLAQDEPFIKAFNTGADPHQQTADYLNSVGLNITRQQAKTINFLLIYYGSARRLSQELNIDVEFATRIRNQFFNQHPQMLRWIHATMNQVKKFGWVESLFGRVRRLPEVWDYDDYKVGHALKQAGNFVVQSVAASITKRAMLKLAAADFMIVNQVHDSITCMVAPWDAEVMLAEMLRIMGDVVKLSIPVVADGKIIETFKE
jgi:DNA polymerase-1